MNWLPIEGTPVESQTTSELVLMVNNFQAPITVSLIIYWTKRDPFLFKVCRYFCEGWSKHDWYILWLGTVVVYFLGGRNLMLTVLDIGHLGNTKDENMGKGCSLVAWPALDDMVRKC